MENHNSRSWNPIVPSFLSTKLFKYLNSPSIFNFSCIEPCSFTVISAFFALAIPLRPSGFYRITCG